MSIPAPYRTRHEFIMAFMANVAMTSATAVTGQQQGRHGQRPGKPKAGMSGDDLAMVAYFNMRSVARMIASICTRKVHRQKNGKSGHWTVSMFVSQAISHIHRGLSVKLKDVRRHQVSSGHGCPVKQVERRWKAFMDELQKKLDRDDPAELCAWVEYQVRYAIHPFADGSGRMATALSAWIMLRSKRAIPSYAFWQRSKMHEMLRRKPAVFYEYYLRVCFPSKEAPTNHVDPPRAVAA